MLYPFSRTRKKVAHDSVRGLAVVVACCSLWAPAHADSVLVGPFSAGRPGGPLPPGWHAADFKSDKERTSYALVDAGGITVLRAEAHASASGLTHAVAVPADARPLLQWRWKIANVLKKSDPTTKEGDDYAARVYVMFDYPLERLPLAERLRLRLARALYDPDVPAAALCYVWDSRLPVGTILESPYTSRVRIVVAASGARHVNDWIAVERDVGEDFRRAFGEEPPAISGVALATDTDNTREDATAWYGDIVLKKRTVTAPARP